MGIGRGYRWRGWFLEDEHLFQLWLGGEWTLMKREVHDQIPLQGRYKSLLWGGG